MYVMNFILHSYRQFHFIVAHYDQLDLLSSVNSFDTLVVSTDGNPITLLSLWKQYAIAKLNLVSINDDIVSYHTT